MIGEFTGVLTIIMLFFPYALMPPAGGLGETNPAGWNLSTAINGVYTFNETYDAKNSYEYYGVLKQVFNIPGMFTQMITKVLIDTQATYSKTEFWHHNQKCTPDRGVTLLAVRFVHIKGWAIPPNLNAAPGMYNPALL